jgi:hypothetical protein
MKLGFISVLIHEIIIGMWCIVSATRVIGHLFCEIINLHQCVTQIVTPFLSLVWLWENLTFLPQDSATSHKENNSMLGIENTIDDRTLSRVLWTQHLPDLNLCNLYLWDTLKNKCILIFLTLSMIWKEGIQNLVTSVSPWNLHVQWKTCVLGVMYT